MKKKYTRLPYDKPFNPALQESALWIPFLSIRVGAGHQQTPRFMAVVDSGSPWCLFKADVADYLGIDWHQGIEQPIGGITGPANEPVYFQRVKIHVESDWVIDVMAGFCKKLTIAGILGRNGFFDNFYVRFDHSKKPSELEISKIDKLN